MALTKPYFTSNSRLVNASNNAPALRRGESDSSAVRILQHALFSVQASTFRRSLRRDGTLDGDYGSETVNAVSSFQERFGLAERGCGDGIAGRLTIHELDSRAPDKLASLSITAAPLITPVAESPETLRPSLSATPRLPSAYSLAIEYEKFKAVRGKPCAQGITHQCAIRMSVALKRCDIGFYFDDSIEYTHSATNPRCGVGIAHNASASRLFAYLNRLWSFQRYERNQTTSANSILTAINGRPGIIFFKECSDRGDHIDFWNGRVVMNDLFNYNAGSERDPENGRTSVRWFRNSSEIWYLPISWV